MTIGAMALPPVSDRLGRRRMIIVSVIVFGIFSLATIWVHSLPMLAVARLLTGLGVGAAVPCMIPLLAEYSPARLSSRIITIVSCSWPLGAVLGGAISAYMLPIFGWRSIFILGGILPLALALGLGLFLPESIRFLVARHEDSKRIIRILRRMWPEIAFPEQGVFVRAESPSDGAPLNHLFAGRRGAMTLLLWASFFMNFLVIFFIFNWMPPLLQQASLPMHRAIVAAIMFNLGGIAGCLSLGILMARFGQFVVVATAYACGAASVMAIGLSGLSAAILPSAVFIAGFCLVGGQACGNVFAANLYPLAIRATAVGWAYGVGRIGSIVGPVVGGIMFKFGWKMNALFTIAAIPLLCAAAAIALLSQVSARTAEREGLMAIPLQADRANSNKLRR